MSEAESAAHKYHLEGPAAHATFAQAAISYLECQKSDRFIKKLAEYWKDTLLRDITAEGVRKSAFKLYPGVQGATRNRQVLVPMQAIMNHAAGLNWCSAMKIKKFPVMVRSKVIIDPAWAERFAENASPHLGALCIFMLGTAARISQALQVTWSDVDFENRTVRIPMSKKNHEEYVAHLPEEVVVALKRIPGDHEPSSNVFGYAKRDSVTQPWTNAVKRAGLSHRSPHCCRHGFATLMLRAGYDVKTVAVRGGWKDPAVVLKSYAHAIEDQTVTDAVFAQKPHKQTKSSSK